MSGGDTVHGAQLGLEAWVQAGQAAQAKADEQIRNARRAGKGAETSRTARPAPLRRSRLETLILEEIEARGPGTADQLGHRLRLRHGDVSDWLPNTMSSRCNALLKQRRIMRRRKDENASGRLAWVWEIRDATV